MGTWLDLSVDGATRDLALASSEAAVRAIDEAEARLSTWRPESELALVNKGAAAVHPLSPLLATELRSALLCAVITEGAFDPTVAPLVQAWGLRGAGRVPTALELEAARQRVDYRQLRVVDGKLHRGLAGVAVEEGGFGKGAALDRALAALRAAGAVEAVVDLGGQVAWLGGPRTIAIAHPWRRDKAAVVAQFPEGSVSTSGNSERGLVVRGVRIGHLLDPRTGRPAPDFGSVTVWAPTALQADCLSTALFVMGPDAALAWAEAHREFRVLVLDARGTELKVLRSRNWPAKQALAEVAPR